jgi:two-component system phosphate regulon sensor histidine kinase PhoR
VEILAPVLERARPRVGIVGGVAVATLVYAVVGGLSVEMAVVGIGGALLWALLWPGSEVSAIPSAATPVQRADVRAVEVAATKPVLPLGALDGVPEAALVLDERGSIIAANIAAQGISPVPTGRPLAHWSRAPELLSAVEAARSTGQQQRSPVRLLAPVERSLDMIVTPLAGSTGTSEPALLIVLRDLTEQEQLSRMRADFVANASHELRTPLASLRGFVETLQGPAKDDPAARERFLGIMQAQGERMSRLIEDLLSLSRIEMREHVLPTGKADLAAVTREVIASLRPAADAAGITMQLAATPQPSSVIGDRDELAQVVQNLVQNAIKYGRKGGLVEVAIRQGNGRILLEVADNGIGIAPEHLPRLTERFYRVSAKESKERGGTGLGLAIVKHIVNRHRGELRIASVLGQGSRFTVELPASTKS